MTYLEEALSEWQWIATTYSDLLKEIGLHTVAIHQAPHEYDSMSSLACTGFSCLSVFAKDYQEKAERAWRYVELTR